MADTYKPPQSLEATDLFAPVITMSPLHRLYIITAWLYIIITFLEHLIESQRAAAHELEASIWSKSSDARL